MKLSSYAAYAVLISLFSLWSLSAMAESNHSFKKNKFYLAEGRWFSSTDGHLFKVNEGNANEETIVFKTNPLDLGDKVKYKLCFKIQSDCSINCRGEVVKNIQMLAPWNQIDPLIPDSKGGYIHVPEATCKETKS